MAECPAYQKCEYIIVIIISILIVTVIIVVVIIMKNVSPSSN